MSVLGEGADGPVTKSRRLLWVLSPGRNNKNFAYHLRLEACSLCVLFLITQVGHHTNQEITRKIILGPVTLGECLTENVFPIRVTKNYHEYILGTHELTQQSYRTQRESVIKNKSSKNLQSKTLASRRFIWWDHLVRAGHRAGEMLSQWSGCLTNMRTWVQSKNPHIF